MHTNNIPEAPVVKKESKNKIRIEFDDRTPLVERLKKRLTSAYFWQNIVFYIFRFVLMLGVSYVILYPFFSKIAGSFMSPSDFVDPTVRIIPKAFTLDIYKAIAFENSYFTALLNTTVLSVSAALVQTFICCLIGYGLAKFKFKGSKIVLIFVIITMVIPHDTIRYAMQMHFRYFDLGGVQAWHLPGLFQLFGQETFDLTNTFAPLLIISVSGLAFKNGLYIFMMRQFFHGVPDELEESAYVDGSGVMKTFFKIILPLSVPMMITIFLFAFSWQWTDNFYTELFFTNNKTILMPHIVTTPTSLKTGADYAAQNLYYTAIDNTAGLMIIAPLLVVYLFCQRYLIQGIERSGIVG